ncbi:MAG: energy-coupling factor ABC transporter ATP-binding protein [Acidimicrobiia bacterium]|nr:energy-coupling factor ABC transporter ATP-binding protein [Acidimicrobiia bacterium]
MSHHSIVVDDLAYSYPDGTSALTGVSFVLEPGERVALLGANGAGKTTLALHLNGLLTPERGTVRVAGLPVEEPHLMEVRRRVGIVFQDPDDQLFMPTLAEDVAFGPANLGLAGVELERCIDDALDAMGLLELRHRAPHHLSFGQRRRAAVATVLSMRPDILVFDEPTSNMDQAGRREFAEVLETLDVTMLTITHDVSHALRTCPRAIVMSGGRIVADGPTAELLANEQLLAANRHELPYGLGLTPECRRAA